MLVSNTASAIAHAVSVTDVLPAGTTYTPGSASAVPASGFTEVSVTPGPGAGETTVVWTHRDHRRGLLADDHRPRRHEPVPGLRRDADEQATAQATDAPDPVSDTGSRIVSTSADLEATKSGPATGVPGGPDLTYTIGVTNHGPSVARSVTLSDPLPAERELRLGDGRLQRERGHVSCAAGDLAVGASFSARRRRLRTRPARPARARTP